MPNVSKLTLDDVTYDVKDVAARENITAEAAARTIAINAAITAEAAARTAGINTTNARIDNIVAQSGEDITEIVDARDGIDSTDYSSLKARLDGEVSLILNNMSVVLTKTEDEEGVVTIKGGIPDTVPSTVLSSITPQQSGSGIPSASNVRPFIEFTKLYTSHGGEHTGGGGTGSIPDEVQPFYGGSINGISGLWTNLYGHISAYSGETLSGRWWSDRDEYVEGATPTVGAEVVYELTTPVTYISSIAWASEGVYFGENRYFAEIGPDASASDTSLRHPMHTVVIMRTFAVNEYAQQSIKEINNTISGLEDDIAAIQPGLSDDAKTALLACFQKVAWIDDEGQTYYDALYDALFPSAVSISATFAPGSHVFYETDTLDALRPYLIVRATMPDSTVKVVSNYILTGSMAAGTNTITVRYQGLTDTFEVTTQANPAYIEAVFTQPQTTIYTDDSLDSLKSNLVVTYYAQPGATGTVVASSAYTLIGTLTEGTSVITASYQGLTDTFNVTAVDFYNIDTWSMSNGLVSLSHGSYGSYNNTLGVNGKDANDRRCAYTDRGKSKVIHSVTFDELNMYPIPIPPTATSVTVSITPTTMYVAGGYWLLDEVTNKYTRIDQVGWSEASFTLSMTSGANHFLSVNIKKDSAGSAFTSEPSNLVIEFS